MNLVLTLLRTPKYGMSAHAAVRLRSAVRRVHTAEKGGVKARVESEVSECLLHDGAPP